jgi:hypothetical protein
MNGGSTASMNTIDFGLVAFTRKPLSRSWRGVPDTFAPPSIAGAAGERHCWMPSHTR